MTAITDTSLKNLLRISFPMMMTFMSGHGMLFVNRLLLADYSLEAMNGMATAGMIAAIFQFGVASVASIAEVFVGQNNGLKHYNKMGESVWQMIWFALATQILFVMIAYGFSDLLIPQALHEHGLIFFKIIMYFGCLQGVFTALSGFYVGQGKTLIVTVAAVIGNLVNLVLNYFLIFGWGEKIPPLGTIGSAIATVAASGVQSLILLIVFLKPSNRLTFGTRRYHLNFKLMKECLRIGTPAAIGHMLEIVAWSIIAHILAAVGNDFITIQNLCSSFFLLFSFFSEGLQKGMIAITSNLIGAQKIKEIGSLLRNGMAIHFAVMALLIIPLFIYPHSLSALFSIPATSSLGQEFQLAMRLLWIFFLFDGLVWVTSGILVSAGDTKFIMVVNAITAWLFAVLPVKLITSYTNLSAGKVWGIVTVYAFFNFCFFYQRYRSQKWLKLRLN
ncbi:MAG: MATE family efflux transporter [Candidatus Paracaedibacteraceae bacterium]|nr:MATE family efflux transporter [Candidatus Paracaedibacteraceae bacterium]